MILLNIICSEVKIQELILFYYLLTSTGLDFLILKINKNNLHPEKDFVVLILNVTTNGSSTQCSGLPTPKCGRSKEDLSAKRSVESSPSINLRVCIVAPS